MTFFDEMELIIVSIYFVLLVVFIVEESWSLQQLQ